jgi:hypothetical protein
MKQHFQTTSENENTSRSRRTIEDRGMIHLFSKRIENKFSISYNVRKVTSRYEYFLLIFALRLGMTQNEVGIDTELKSLSNGDIFKAGHRAKNRVFTQLGVRIPTVTQPHTLTLKHARFIHFSQTNDLATN